MFCGTRSFKHIDGSPTRCCKKKHRSKNPYSTRGLEKFSTVMAELEARRAKIVARAAPQDDILMVRFRHSDSVGWIPIVVKSQERAKSFKTQVSSKEGGGGGGDDGGIERESKLEKRRSFSWGLVEERWRPIYYWPVAVAVVVLCFVIFGRKFAICCTSIWWYLVGRSEGVDEEEGLCGVGSGLASPRSRGR